MRNIWLGYAFLLHYRRIILEEGTIHMLKQWLLFSLWSLASEELQSGCHRLYPKNWHPTKIHVSFKDEVSTLMNKYYSNTHYIEGKLTELITITGTKSEIWLIFLNRQSLPIPALFTRWSTIRMEFETEKRKNH